VNFLRIAMSLAVGVVCSVSAATSSAAPSLSTKEIVACEREILDTMGRARTTFERLHPTHGASNKKVTELRTAFGEQLRLVALEKDRFLATKTAQSCHTAGLKANQLLTWAGTSDRIK